MLLEKALNSTLIQCNKRRLNGASEGPSASSTISSSSSEARHSIEKLLNDAYLLVMIKQMVVSYSKISYDIIP